MPDEREPLAEPEVSIPLAEALSTAATIRDSARRRKTPLVTAVEIENFKGIGNPVRIDLRPVTLLFGRNSAGKSTVLHALCYAHDILSHRSVDARKTELGGDQVDLRGFRNFVHGHDLDRAVRLRFELNLAGWQPSEWLLKNSKHVKEEEDSERIESLDPVSSAESAWVALAVKWSRFDEKPVLASYEVGVNGSLFGRIQTDNFFDISLGLNPSHALIESVSQAEPEEAYGVREPHGVTVSTTNQPGLLDVAVHGGLKSPLPDWEEPLDLDTSDLRWITAPGRAGFQTLADCFLVGIGHALQTELANLRYIGPARELRPPADVESGLPSRGSWSDGSAAWSLLRQHDLDPRVRDLLDEVNGWLAPADRLDTGYKLRRHSTVELPADLPPVSRIRLREQLTADIRDEEGNVDLDRWVRKEAAEIVDLVGGDPDDMRKRITAAHEDESDSANATDEDATAAEDIIQPARKLYQIIADAIAAVDALERGRSPAGVKALVSAIAAAPLRTTLELVTVGSELPVRTSDIGVGVSQVLPVVVGALDPDRPGITAIEQPELHIHPRMQVELGALVAQRVDQGGVFLIETHSEHLMLRLLRRIEETHSGELPEGKSPLKPAHVSVVFVEQIGGEARTTPLRIDDTGEFKDRWPHGFFDERSDELF